MVRVCYQGVPGAYSEAAALEIFGKDATLLPCATFEEVFEKVVSGESDRAALPIENSLAGTIHRNLDLLIAHSEVHIVGELDYRVRHCLIKRRDQSRESIKRVFSHPMALAQCEKYLRGRGLEAVEGFDTAGSAKMLMEGSLTSDSAAIAGRRAADLYDLDVVEEGIEDDKENYTRFLVLSLTPMASAEDGVPCKTSIAFTLDNKPGVLCKALGAFSVLDLDMTKIESRHVHSLHSTASSPNAGSRLRWRYIFYADIAADYNKPSTRTAFTLLSQITSKQERQQEIEDLIGPSTLTAADGGRHKRRPLASSQPL